MFILCRVALESPWQWEFTITCERLMVLCPATIVFEHVETISISSSHTNPEFVHRTKSVFHFTTVRNFFAVGSEVPVKHTAETLLPETDILDITIRSEYLSSEPCMVLTLTGAMYLIETLLAICCEVSQMFHPLVVCIVERVDTTQQIVILSPEALDHPFIIFLIFKHGLRSSVTVPN